MGKKKPSVPVQGMILKTVTGRNVFIRTRKDRVFIYHKEGKEYVFSGISVRKREYASIIKDSKGRVSTTSVHRKQQLPYKVKKVQLKPSSISLSLLPSKKKKGAQFVKKLRAEGISASLRKKDKEIIMKAYTQDQKRYIVETYKKDFTDIGRLRPSP